MACFLGFFVRCMECDRPSLNPLEFLGKIFLHPSLCTF